MPVVLALFGCDIVFACPAAELEFFDEVDIGGEILTNHETTYD